MITGKTLNDLAVYDSKYDSENRRVLYVLKGFELTNNEVKQFKAIESMGDMIARKGEYTTATELYQDSWARGNQSERLLQNHAFVTAKADISSSLDKEIKPLSINQVIKKVTKSIRIKL